jgi:hypothetical protein
MAFNEITRGKFCSDRLVNCVNGRTDKGGTAAFTVSEDVFRKIGSPVFVSRLVGSLEHAGMVCFIPKSMPGTATTRLSSHSTSKARYISVPAGHLGLAKMNRPTMSLPFEITSDGLIVDYRPLIAAKSSVSPAA